MTLTDHIKSAVINELERRRVTMADALGHSTKGIDATLQRIRRKLARFRPIGGRPSNGNLARRFSRKRGFGAGRRTHAGSEIGGNARDEVHLGSSHGYLPSAKSMKALEP